MTNTAYYKIGPNDPPSSRFAALGAKRTPGALATQATFACNEFQEK